MIYKNVVGLLKELDLRIALSMWINQVNHQHISFMSPVKIRLIKVELLKEIEFQLSKKTMRA